MPRYLIERDLPGAANLTTEDLAKIARTSNDAVASLGVPYTWVTSYVAGDKIYACTRRRMPRRSANTPAAAASRAPWWPR